MLRVRILGPGGAPASLPQKVLAGVVVAAVLAVVVLLMLGLWVVGAVVLTGAAVVGLVRALLPGRAVPGGAGDDPQVIEGRVTPVPDDPSATSARIEREPPG
jgi:hypothetical protein